MINYNHVNIRKIKEFIDKRMTVAVLVENSVDSSLMDLLVYAIKKESPVVLYVKEEAQEHFYNLLDVLGLDALIKESKIKIINAGDRGV